MAERKAVDPPHESALIPALPCKKLDPDHKILFNIKAMDNGAHPLLKTNR